MSFGFGSFFRRSSRDSAGGLAGSITRVILRLLQFILAITVAGLYGVDLHNATEAGIGADAKWVFAEVVAGLSAFTCLVYGFCFLIPSETLFAWDWTLLILWTALFGIFGHIYIPDHPTPEQRGQIRMKHAVWVDLVNMLLWFITAVLATVFFLRGRNHKTLHTGRAKV